MSPTKARTRRTRSDAPRAHPRAKAQRAAILQALGAGSTRSAAAGHAGVARDTFYRWLREDKAFAGEVEKAESSVQVRYEALLLRAADGGDVQAIKFWLERRRRDDYSPRQELTGKDGGPIDVQGFAAKLDPGEAEALLAHARRELEKRDRAGGT